VNGELTEVELPNLSIDSEPVHIGRKVHFDLHGTVHPKSCGTANKPSEALGL
jgi:hypothetical protein